MSLQGFNYMGAPLQEIMADMKLLPVQVLGQYRNDPTYGTAAAAELSRRARVEAEAKARETPDASGIPTVMEELERSLATGQQFGQEGVPALKGGIANYTANPTPAPQQPQQQPQQPPLQQAQQQAQPQQMLASNRAYANGGIVAFREGGGAPRTDDESAGQQVPMEQLGLDTPEGIYKFATTLGPLSQAYQAAIPEYKKYLRDLKPALLDEAERNRIQSEKFNEFQAVSKPYYEKMQGLLDEERKSVGQRSATADALQRFGLAMMGGRGNLASIVSEAGIGALDYFNKAKQAEAGALKAAREGEMALIRSRMADERGDRTAAQAEVNRYQLAKEKEQNFELDKEKALLEADKTAALEEGKNRRNVVDEFSRMHTAKEARESREGIAKLQREANNIARAAGMRTTDFEKQIDLIAGPYIRAGMPREQAREKAYAEFLGIKNQAATDRSAVAVAKLVDAQKLRDPIYREARAKNDILGMQAREAELAKIISNRLSSPAGSPVAPAASGDGSSIRDQADAILRGGK